MTMDDNSPLSLRSIWQALRQRWFTLLFVAALLFSGIAAYVFSLKPRVTAGAGVLLPPVTEELGDGPTTQRVLATTDPFFIRSETAIIGSGQLSRHVIDKLDLAGNAEFASEPSLLEQLGIRKPSRGDNPFLSKDELAED